MKILMTGASGFLGTNFLASYEHTTKDVCCISSKKIKGFRTIICADHFYNELKIDEPFETLLLFGAVTPKGFGQEMFVDYMTNFFSVFNLLNKLQSIPKKIIFASSVSVYKQDGVICEDTPLSSSDPYALSKIVCEEMLKDYCKRNGTSLLIARLGNLYGPGEDKYNKLIGGFLRSVFKNNAITLFTKGEELRNLFYVGDVCKFLKNAITHDYGKQLVLNCCSKHHYTIKEIAETVISVTGQSAQILYSGESSTSHIGNIRSDFYNTDLFQKIWLNDNTEMPLPDGIEKTLESFKNI